MTISTLPRPNRTTISGAAAPRPESRDQQVVENPGDSFNRCATKAAIGAVALGATAAVARKFGGRDLLGVPYLGGLVFGAAGAVVGFIDHRQKFPQDPKDAAVGSALDVGKLSGVLGAGAAAATLASRTPAVVGGVIGAALGMLAHYLEDHVPV